MRYLLISIMTIFLGLASSPVFALCHIDGPHNCSEENEDALVALTKNTINQMQLTNVHAFKTQNDTVLEEFAKNHAQLSQIPNTQTYINPAR